MSMPIPIGLMSHKIMATAATAATESARRSDRTRSTPAFESGMPLKLKPSTGERTAVA